MEDTYWKEELWRLTENCTLKRSGLFEQADASVAQRRKLSLIAGILALLSAGSVLSLLADFSSPGAMKVIAVVFSTASGFVSLMISFTYKDDQIQQLFIGASKYLALRDRCQRLLVNESLTDKQRTATLEEIQNSYAELDGIYGRYLDGLRRKLSGSPAPLALYGHIEHVRGTPPRRPSERLPLQPPVGSGAPRRRDTGPPIKVPVSTESKLIEAANKEIAELRAQVAARERMHAEAKETRSDEAAPPIRSAPPENKMVDAANKVIAELRALAIGETPRAEAKENREKEPKPKEGNSSADDNHEP